MAQCPNGHHNRRVGFYCTTCGVAMSSPNPWIAPPPSGWPPPATPAAAARRPVSRAAWIGAAAVAVALVLVVVSLVVMGNSTAGRDDASGGPGQPGRAIGASRELIVVDTVGEDGWESERHLVRAGDDLDRSVPFVRDASPVAVRTVPAASTAVEVSMLDFAQPLELVETERGAVVAWFDGEATTVALAGVGTGVERTLFRTLNGATVWVDAGWSRVLVQERVSPDEVVCLSAPIGTPVVEIARGGSCEFSASGRALVYDHAAGTDPGDDAYEVRVFEVDGSEMSAFSTVGVPEINRSGARVQAVHPDQLSVFETSTGRLLQTREGPADPQGWVSTGDLLVAQAEGDEHAVRFLGDQQQGYRGKDEVLISGRQVRAQPFGPRWQAVVAARDDDGTELVLADGREPLDRPLFSGPVADFRIIEDPGGREEALGSRLLVWSLDGSRVWLGSPDFGNLAEVGSLPAPSGQPTVSEVVVDPATGVIYADVYDERDGSSLVAIGTEVTVLASGHRSATVQASTGHGVVAVVADDASHRSLVWFGPDGEVVLDRGVEFSRVVVRDGFVTYSALDHRGGVARPQLRVVPVDGSTEPAVIYDDVSISVGSRGPDPLIRIPGFGTGVDWVS